MTQTERNNWEKVRANGRGRYIVVEGILKRGLLAGVIIGAFPFLIHSLCNGWTTDWLLLVILFVVAAFISGSIMGGLFWHLQESEYQKGF